MQTQAPPDTFATYLAKQYIFQKGYKPFTVPEAAPLVGAADFVLTYSDGIAFNMVAIVDRTVDAGKKLRLPFDAMVSAVQSCAKYTGKAGGTKLVPNLLIIEVGRQPLDSDGRARLGALKARSGVTVNTIDIATETRGYWSTLPLNGFFNHKRFIEGLLKNPRADDAASRARLNVIFQEERFPLVTYGLLVLLAALFLLEVVISPKHGLMDVDIKTLVRMGGLNRNIVDENHEWFRLLTAAFLHGGLLHIAMNGYVLYMVGKILEQLVGRAWLAALFFFGALGGTLASYALNAPEVVSVGASGAIMAIITAVYVASFRFPPGAPARTRLQSVMLQLLIPSLLPLASAGTGIHVDYGAHFGGTLAGVVAGLLLLKIWPHHQALPKGRAAAGLFGFACTGALLFGAQILLSRYF